MIQLFKVIKNLDQKLLENPITNYSSVNALVDVIKLALKKYLVLVFMLLNRVYVNLLFMMILCLLLEELSVSVFNLVLKIIKKETKNMVLWLFNMLLLKNHSTP